MPTKKYITNHNTPLIIMLLSTMVVLWTCQVSILGLVALTIALIICIVNLSLRLYSSKRVNTGVASEQRTNR